MWLSYGKAYRSPLNPVLALTFDQVNAFARDGVTVVYKTFVDANAVPRLGYDEWEVCEGFPVNFDCTSQQIPPDQFEKVDLENHFLQNKSSNSGLPGYWSSHQSEDHPGDISGRI